MTSYKAMLDCQISGSESLCEELIAGVKIGQTFHCRMDNLNCIEVKFGTYNRTNVGQLVFTLRQQGSAYEIVRLVEHLANIRDNLYHPFEFQPLQKSRGRDFIFEIEAPASFQSNNVVIWKSSRLFQGQRYLNNKPVPGFVVFRSKCRIPKIGHPSRSSYTYPILKGSAIKQEFIGDFGVVDGLSLDLDNYGSIEGSLSIDLSDDQGHSLFKNTIFANQVTNGFPLILPLSPTKAQNKKFILTLSSDKGESGKAIGVRILREHNGGILKINKEVIDGSISFSLRGAAPPAPAKRVVPQVPIFTEVEPTIVFNKKIIHKPTKLEPVFSKKIVGLVDIITLNFNRADLLQRCFEAISKNTTYPEWRWHVCDNGSTDNSVDVLQRLEDPRVTITPRANNLGSFGELNNAIFREHASGDYVLFLNNDVIPKKNWLTEMVNILRNDPEVGIVGGRLYYPNGTPQHLGVLFQHNRIPVNLSHFFMSPKLRNFAEVDRQFQAITGACLLMRSEDFKEIGGFPAGYDYGYEDIDLCLSVAYRLKKKSVVSSGTVAIHEEAATSKKIRRGGRSKDVEYLQKKWNYSPDQHFYLSDFRHKVYLGPKVTKPTFTIVTCVTRPKMWMDNIVRPNRELSQKLEFLPVFNLVEKLSIASAYNRSLQQAKSKYVILCHQDLHFYPGWFKQLESKIKDLPSNWGVIGVAGWTQEGKIMGGLKVPEGRWSKNEGEAHTVDECFLVVRKDLGLKFDERIIESHLYGADICLESLSRGFKNYAIQLPVEHRESGAHPENWITSYYQSLKRFKNKWLQKFHVIRTTTCVLRQGCEDIVGLKPPRKV